MSRSGKVTPAAWTSTTTWPSDAAGSSTWATSTDSGPSNRTTCTTSTCASWPVEEHLRELDHLGPEVLAQALGLRVEPGGRRHPLAQQPLDHEVEGPQVGQLVALDGQRGDLGQQLRQALDGQEAGQPHVG